MVMVLGIIMVAELLFKKKKAVEADVEEDDGYKKT